MEHRAMLARDRGQFRDGLDRPDLVVGMHDRDQRRVVPDRLAQRGRLDDAALGGVQPRDLPAASLERLRGVQHRFVLEARGDETPAGSGVERVGGATERQVVGLGPARGEHDLGRVRVDERRDFLARVVDERFRALPERVHR
jgi:hypothetical protein